MSEDSFVMPGADELARLSWHHLVIEATGFKRGKERGVLFTKGERSYVTTPYEGQIEYEHDVKKPRMGMASSDARYGPRFDDPVRFTPEGRLFNNVIYLGQLCVKERWTGARIVSGSDSAIRLMGAFFLVNQMKCPDHEKDLPFNRRNKDLLKEAFVMVEDKEWQDKMLPKFNAQDPS